MSHAAVLIALDPTDDVDSAIEEQMAPFDEGAEWFADGSRWDWYVVGGRFTGTLDGYDPNADDRNYATCRLCAGTGKRLPPPNVGPGDHLCNGCDGTGTARNFHNAGHDGDIITRGSLDLDTLSKRQRERGIRRYEKAKLDSSPEFMYGVNPAKTTLDEYLAGLQSPIACPAFLHHRVWHEAERMGWFGGTALTECEIKANDSDVEAMVRRCQHRDEATGARIVVWNEPWEVWAEHFYKRFVEKLPPETLLAVVDYHV